MVKINAIVSALLLGVAIALFTPVFSEIAMQFGTIIGYMHHILLRYLNICQLL
jgi:hypothetical protein